MYCINCGKELPENARFCLYCGAKVNIAEKKQVSNDEVLTQYFVNTIPFIYDDLVECDYEDLCSCIIYPYIYGYINGKVGLLDANDASMVVPCQYDKIDPYFYTESKQFAYSEVNKDGKWGFFEKGKEIVPCIYDSINPQKYNNTRIYIVAIGSKKGLINRNTWDKTECIYDEINFEADGIYVSIADKHGILDAQCTEILPCIFEKYETHRSYYKVYNGKKCGIYMRYKCLVPCIYDDVSLEGSHYKISKDGKYGIFKEKEIIAPIYNDIEYVAERERYNGAIRDNGYFKVFLNSKVGLFSLNGHVIFPTKYDRIEKFMSMVLATNWIPQSYQNVSIGYIVQQNNKVSFIANDGKEFMNSPNFNFNAVKMMYNDEHYVYYKVCRNGKWGVYASSEIAEIEIVVFISSNRNISLREIIPCKYDSPEDIRF